MNDPVGRCFSVKPRRGRPFCSFATSTEAIGLFPRGIWSRGKPEEETAKREIREETGLLVRLDPGFRRSVRYSPKPGVDKDVIYFLGFPTGGNPAVQKEEIREMRWLPGTEALRLVTYDNDRQVLEGAIAYLGRERKA